MGLIVAVAKIVHTDAFMSIGGVDKLARASVDADMRDATLVGVLKKHKIARLKFVSRHCGSVVILLGRCAGQVNAIGRAQNIADEARAVKAGAGRSTHDIPGSAKRICGSDDIAAGNGFVLHLRFGGAGCHFNAVGQMGFPPAQDADLMRGQRRLMENERLRGNAGLLMNSRRGNGRPGLAFRRGAEKRTGGASESGEGEARAAKAGHRVKI